MTKAADKQQIALRFSADELETINHMRRDHDDPPTQPGMIKKIVQDAIADYRKKQKKAAA